MEVNRAIGTPHTTDTRTGWANVPLGRLASFTSGAGILVSSLREFSSDFPVPVFGGNGIAGYTNRTLVDGPTVVVGRVGQKCGEVYLTDGPAWITDNALYPRVGRQEWDVRFFAYALSHVGLNRVRNRNDLPLVTQAILHEVELPWPSSVVEQQAIAQALSDVDDLIQSLERLIAKKRGLKQAAMQQLLTGQTRLPGHGDKGLAQSAAQQCPKGWRSVRIKELGKWFSGSTPAMNNPRYWRGATPWVSPKDMKSLRLFDAQDHISSEAVADGCRVLPAGAILMVIRGMILAHSFPVAKAERPLACNQDIKAVVVNDDVHCDFVLYWLALHSRHLLSLATESTHGTKRLPPEMLFKESMFLPPLAEQIAITEVLSDIDAEIDALEARLTKTRDLKQGMMQELLAGRTRLV